MKIKLDILGNSLAQKKRIAMVVLLLELKSDLRKNLFPSSGM